MARAVDSLATPGACAHYHSRMCCKMNPWVRRLALATAMLAVSTPYAADVYRWSDEQGRVHYGQRPPPQGAQKMLLPDTAAGSVTADQASAQRRDRQQRLLEAFEYEREQKRAADTRAAQLREQDAAHCRDLQESWRLLSHPGPVYRTLANGERRYLSEDERAAEKADLRQAHLKTCGIEPR